MKKLLVIALLGVTVFTMAIAEPPPKLFSERNRLVEYVKEQGKIYTVYVPKEDWTLINFPGPVDRFNISESKLFQVIFRPGDYYIRVMAMSDFALGVFEVISGNDKYILHLKQVPGKEFMVVNFQNDSSKEKSVVQFSNDSHNWVSDIPWWLCFLGGFFVALLIIYVVQEIIKSFEEERYKK